MKKSTQQGFTLVEVLIATIILMTVVAVVMGYISTAQRRFDSEQTKLDMTEESREFMDSIARDLHMAGYPTPRMFQPGLLPNPAWYDSTQVATGIVSVSATQLLLEGDVDNDGVVDAVRYQLVPDFPAGVVNPNQCPCRLQRGRLLNGKQAAASPAPMNQPLPPFYVEAQGIINSGNVIPLGAVGGNYAGYTAEPVFRAYDVNGAPMALPLDLTMINPLTGRSFVFDIRTIRVTLNVLGSINDNQTGIPPVITMSTTAKVNNF